MGQLIGKYALLGLSALALSAASTGAWADPLPGLVNQNFELYSGQSPKGYFDNVDPTGWTGGSGLIFIDSQAFAQSAAGPVYLQTYGNPTGSVTGNYVEADGNPYFESGFNYTVTGLTVGKTYSLSFYQGASEQTGFGTPGLDTTNRWIVSLGTSGLSLKSGGPVDPVYGPTDIYYSTDASASITASPLMTVPYGKAVGWNYVTVNLTADATTDVLSFLAWGDNGSTINLPPIAFLSGVDSPAGLGSGVPELSTWAMMGLGFIGLGLVAQRRRAKNLETAQA